MMSDKRLANFILALVAMCEDNEFETAFVYLNGKLLAHCLSLIDVINLVNVISPNTWRFDKNEKGQMCIYLIY